MTDLQLDFDDAAERDRQYRIAASVAPEVFNDCLQRYASLTRSAAAQLRTELGVVYDSTSGSSLDLFHGTGDAAAKPVLIYIHGGYWRMLAKEDSAFMAQTFAAAGISVAALDYTLAPAARLEEIVRQVRAAVAWIYIHGAAHGLDKARIYVAGSSAGGHLAACIAADGWQAEFGLPRDVIKAAFPVSGIFDLRPLTKSFVNEWLQLNATEAAALSPLQLPPPACPVHLFWGEHETQVFKDQSRAYHRVMSEQGVQVQAQEVPGRNHFDVILDLADSGSALGGQCLAAIGATK